MANLTRCRSPETAPYRYVEYKDDREKYGLVGVETAIDNILVTAFTSIAIARYLGPEHSRVLSFLCNGWHEVAGNFGAVGIPAHARKYMAEFLGERRQRNCEVYFSADPLLQSLLASVATAGHRTVGPARSNAELRMACILIALSIWPQMVNSIPAQANVAAEDLFRNMPASALSMLTFFLSITATVFFHWGVVGVGASVLLCRSVDFLVRFIPTFRWIFSWEITHAHPEGLRERAIGFALQSLVTMALGMVVWDRSEYFLLKILLFRHQPDRVLLCGFQHGQSPPPQFNYLRLRDWSDDLCSIWKR